MAGEQTIVNEGGGRKIGESRREIEDGHPQNGDGGFCNGESRRENGDRLRQIGGGRWRFGYGGSQLGKPPGLVYKIPPPYCAVARLLLISPHVPNPVMRRTCQFLGAVSACQTFFEQTFREPQIYASASLR